jgi:hypothetical protein
MKNINKYIIAVSVIVILLISINLLSNSRYNSLTPSGYDARQIYSPFNFHERFAVNPLSPVDAGPVLVVYTQENKAGTTSRFTSSVDNLVPKGLNDKINSFTLGPYTRVTFYRDTQFKGVSVVYENKQDLNLDITSFKEETMKGQASSFKLELIAPYIVAYNGQNLGGGNSKVFGGNKPNLTSDWSGKLVSFKISPNTRLTTYDKTGFTGTPKVFENNTSKSSKVMSVGPIKIQSFKLEKTFL